MLLCYSHSHCVVTSEWFHFYIISGALMKPENVQVAAPVKNKRLENYTISWNGTWPSSTVFVVMVKQWKKGKSTDANTVWIELMQVWQLINNYTLANPNLKILKWIELKQVWLHLQTPRFICKYHKILSVCFFQYYSTFNVSTAGLSQLVEHLTIEQEFVSSIPKAPPIFRVLK